MLHPAKPAWFVYLGKIAPGLAGLLRYKRQDLPHDLLAGMSVAAEALPVGVAYAQLAGFKPGLALYSSILPLFCLRNIWNFATIDRRPGCGCVCALVAAAVTPFSCGDQNLYESLSVALALLAGLLCIGASFLRLGALADFLSKPILVGFLNGNALSIMLGQIGKILWLSHRQRRDCSETR
jgi:MFS superfamily sulfate permease-like transporter